MKNELYTPDQLVLLMHKLSTNGIRFSKIPAGIYTTKGISGKAVVEWIKSEMELYENDRMEEVRNKALDLRKDDGDVEDTLAEMRKRWGKDVPILKDKRFDEIITQYFCLSHEAGIAALGQELTACGYALYDLDGDEIYLLELLPQTEMQTFEKNAGSMVNIANFSNNHTVILGLQPGISIHESKCPVKKWNGRMTASVTS